MNLIKYTLSAFVFFPWAVTFAQTHLLTSAGKPAQLSIRKAGEQSIRITLKPLDYADLPYSPALEELALQKPAIELTSLDGPIHKKVGNLTVDIQASPLTVTVKNEKGTLLQELEFGEDGKLSFKKDEEPILGLGEGGHRTPKGENWRSQVIEYDRNGRFQEMQPRWQSDAYGSRNPVPLLIGTEGWALLVASPWGQFDLQPKGRGTFIPWRPEAKDSIPQNEKNQGLVGAKGLPPVNSVIPGLVDVLVFDAHQPLAFMKEVADMSGHAVMPPKWALGYMQSHRTLKDEDEMLGIVRTFREKKIPVDAVIYLGTGFTPRGWNKEQPSFEFNPEVFHRDPKTVLKDFHDQHVKVVLHMVPFDRDQLPTLHGTIPAKPGEVLDASHIQTYWKYHDPLMKIGADAFWPDEGDWFNLYERIKRHQLYYQGPISSLPNTRPWSLHRNGYLGIAKWGGWVWSGDTESSWKTLEGQIAVGINYSLSLSPYWGSDIGGFYANAEKTGELYTRWYQFGAFCPSFRSHGRTWYTSLPWGWGLSDMGVVEGNNNNTADPKRGVQQSEMNNPTIEPITRKYTELRYQLLPYNYSLAWEAHEEGLPFMRALWLYYPNDEKARHLGNEYLWGKEMLIAPVFEKGATAREVYLPEGNWYDWWTNELVAGNRTISRPVDLTIMPIYVSAGAIIPVDPIRQYTDEPIKEATTLKVYPGKDGHFTLYDDDGISLDYLKGKGSAIELSWDDQSRQLSLKPGTAADVSNATSRDFVVQVLPEGSSRKISYQGKAMTVKL